MIGPGPGHDITRYRPISLWRAALSAAEETINSGLFVSAWLRLFQAHLSCSEAEMLRWRGDLGISAEIRRAYSGLYGRYFARALLASELGITDFISLDRDITSIPNGVTVTRIEKGDIPDWIAWDLQSGAYVLGEAKGRLTGSEQQFLSGRPSCINDGKAQFERVEVKDSSDRIIATRNWVAANLWSTDERRRRPVSLLWDPPDEGNPLTNDEVSRHADAIRRYRTTTIANQLGNPAFTVRIAIQPSDEGVSSTIREAVEDNRFGPIERPSQEPHESDYLAAVITPLGIQPIRNTADLETAHGIKESVDDADGPAMIFGLARRKPQTPESQKMPWLSDNGIASPDGLSLFNLENVEIRES